MAGSYDATGTGPSGSVTTHTDWTSTGGGSETVTVPAGTFTGCAKLLSTIKLSGSTANDPGITGTFGTTLWFAKGFGLVKSTVEGGLETDLISTNVAH